MRTNVRVQLELKSEVRPRSIGDFCVQRVRRAPGATTHIYIDPPTPTPTRGGALSSS